ncbi:MAG: helical backbone metal receptor [Pseudomonadota bacterium]
MAKSSLNRMIVVLLIAALAFGGSYLGKRALRAWKPAASLSLASQKTPAHLPCRRIVSLAPSITETLFALGLGDNVAAVTRYCEFPAEARKKVRIGGFYDANYEAILSLAPDLVILLPEQDNIRQFLDKAGFNVLVVNNKTIADIYAAIAAIGRRCGVEERSASLAADLTTRRDHIRQGARSLSHPRVMVSIGGNMGGHLDKICVAGPRTFYGQLVDLAGGVNAYQGKLAFPEISREGLIELNPEVIIDIAVNTDYRALGESARAAGIKKWQEAASGTVAARDSRIYVLEKDYMVIPGPRFILALEDITAALHSEAKRNP